MRPIELLLAFLPGRNLGRRGEGVAARHLRRAGLRILARNWRARSGEIDLVALTGRTLVLVEVKSSLRSGDGRPSDAGERDPLGKIDHRKVERIRRAANAYLRRSRASWSSGRLDGMRLDGVVVHFRPGPLGRPVPAEVRWYQNLHPLGRD